MSSIVFCHKNVTTLSSRAIVKRLIETKIGGQNLHELVIGCIVANPSGLWAPKDQSFINCPNDSLQFIFRIFANCCSNTSFT